jgi:hypothetical protein
VKRSAKIQTGFETFTLVQLRGQLVVPGKMRTDDVHRLRDVAKDGQTKDSSVSQHEAPRESVVLCTSHFQYCRDSARAK